MKRNVTHGLAALCLSGILVLSTPVQAAGFQIWEQDGASIANYHAGYAALATDASIAWYNPAGMVRICDQQLVLGAVAIIPSFKFKGSVTVFEPPFPPEPRTFPNATAQGGKFCFVPDIHYVAPLSDCVSFGFSIVAPFGLKTDYGRNSPLRYAATLTSITVVDFSPSLAYRVTNHGSIGFGLDIQKNDAEFDNVGILLANPDINTDTSSTNRVNGTGYGWHAGVLYEFTPNARAGLSYHSQVRHHLSGTSRFVGPIAQVLNENNENLPLVSTTARTNITLPPYTALSYYQGFCTCPRIALMGSVVYTQWSIIKNLTLSNYAGAVVEDFIPTPSTNIQVVVPERFRNTWNVSVGADVHLNDRIILRCGMGYDQTPVRDRYRTVQLPDNDRYVVALGGHYQANHCLGFDIGYMHVLSGRANSNPPPIAMGAQIVSVNGNLRGSADVYGAQVTWNM